MPVPVLVEVNYWVRKLYGQETWTSSSRTSRAARTACTGSARAKLTRAAELERAYESLDLGLVDAAVIATCERLAETKVSTLDRRDFSVVRPRHCERLQLLPE